MPHRPNYIDQRVNDAVGMLYKQSEQRPDSRAECSYQIVVLTILSFLYSSIRRISTLLFLGGGLIAGLLFSALLRAIL